MDFTDEEKEIIQCGGIPNCSQEIKDTIESYFKGSSHSTKLIIEVYDEGGTLIFQKDKETTTNIFGELKDVSLGELLSDEKYTIKIRLKDQRFVLPKVSTVTLNTAEPKAGGGFAAHLKLFYNRQFRYGNFDESNDIIDLNDIQEWSNIISQQPELWDDSNLDGLYGVDLLDVLTLQENWGEIQETQVEKEQITLMELAEVFGLLTSFETKVQVPDWLDFLKLSCRS
jgi:hypothetical protein